MLSGLSMTTRTRYVSIALLWVAACTAKSSDDDDGGTSSRASASATSSTGTTTSSGEGGGETCERAGGSFECGATSCLTDTQFCVLGDPVLGDTCKAIGGDGSTCPACDAVPYDCGADYDTICDGDETTGVTVFCE